MYNKSFFLKLLIKSKLSVKPSLNLINIEIKNPTFLVKVLENQLKLINYTLNSYFLKKIKIAGKSYRIEKVGYGFNLTVGHTLNTYIYVKNIIQNQPSKHKLIFFFLNKKKLQLNFYKIIYLRLWDVYTQRGLRFGKQKLFKKQGKKSSYV